jgi:hypothetical protein
MEIDRASTIDAIEILNQAVSEALHDLIKDWSGERELSFVMVRRAMRHLSFNNFEEMY